VWITSTTNVTITAWFSSNWLNYTVASSGTQQLSNGSKPTAVYLDGVWKAEGDGWSYYGETITAVTGATANVALYWGLSLVSVTIISPSNTTYTSSSVPVEINASGGTIDKRWYNCKNATSWIYGSNQTYTVPTSITGFVNGTSYTFYAWANNTDGNSDEKTVMFNVQIGVHYYFNWNFKDLDANDVESQITWQLYNSSQLLTYTESQATLQGGTYTLKTYYHASLINQTVFDTATYGNTTINIYLQFKAYAYGYLAFNNIVTGLILHNQSMYNLTFTLLGSVPMTMTIDFPHSPTYIFKDGVSQIGWIYTSGHIVLTASSLSVWQIIYVPARTVTVPTNAYFGFGTGYYINFNIEKTFSNVYREGNYWYFDGYGLGFQLQSANMTITDYFVSDSNTLKFTVTAPSGLSTSKVYAASKGVPTSVSGSWTWSYDIATNIVTVQVHHASAVAITIIWGGAPPPPPPPPNPIDNFLHFLWAGDFFGFIIASYTQAFGSADIFFGVAIMLVMIPLYIRTKSLMLMSILWILLGSLFLVAMPLVSGLAVLLLVLGIGSMLYQLFMMTRG
jgi:hypothetical protein